MKMNQEVKDLLQKMPFIPLVTHGKEGPHMIVVGKGFIIDDEIIAFFGWRQGKTSENIRNNGIIQIVVVSEARDKGFRIRGKGHIEKDGEIYNRLAEQFPARLGKLGFVTIMKVEAVESLL